ncbi:hypothetical protein HPB47_015263, partial [Ixodes persulcatus]
AMMMQLYRGLILSTATIRLAAGPHQQHPIFGNRDSSTTQFRALVGDPDIIYTTPPPYAPPLNIIESVPALKSKRSTAQPVVRSLVEDHVETSFAGWLRVYTGGSVLHSPSASLLHRLRTGCAFTAKALHRINSAVNPHCPTCDVPEDFDHLLWDCPTLTKERKSLFDGLQYAGVAHATTEEIFFPPAPAGTASKSFARLLTFLEDTELFDR